MLKALKIIALLSALICAPIVNADVKSASQKEPAQSQNTEKNNEYYKALSVSTLSTLADGGDTRAMYWAGVKSAIQKDNESAITWFQKAFKAGDPLGAHGMGVYYQKVVNPPDYEKAMEWFKTASQKGECHAGISMGEMYLKGTGVEKDVDEAITWFKWSANSNMEKCVTSADWLGLAYETKGNLAESYNWSKLGADKGNLPSARRLVKLHLDSLPSGWNRDDRLNVAISAKDLDLIKYFEMAVRANAKDANARLYLNGLYDAKLKAAPAKSLAPFGQEMGVATIEQVNTQIGARTTIVTAPFIEVNGWADCEKSALFVGGSDARSLGIPGLTKVLFCFADGKLASVRMQILAGASDRILAGLEEKYEVIEKKETPPQDKNEEKEVSAVFKKGNSFILFYDDGKRQFGRTTSVTYKAGSYEEFRRDQDAKLRARQETRNRQEQEQKARDRSQL